MKAKNGFHLRDFFLCCDYPELFADHQTQRTVQAAALRINEACVVSWDLTVFKAPLLEGGDAYSAR
jgi:hypothetical protein